MGSGCAVVGRAVACNTQDPQFESSHWQIYLLSAALNVVNKEERGRERSNLKSLT